MDRDGLMLETIKADIELKRQHAEMLKAKARRENAEAVRIEIESLGDATRITEKFDEEGRMVERVMEPA